MPSPSRARSSWRCSSPCRLSMPTANASMPRSGTRPLRSDETWATSFWVSVLILVLPARNASRRRPRRCGRRTVPSRRTPRIRMAKRRSPRGPPNISAASVSVTVPWAARCSNNWRTPPSGSCASHPAGGRHPRPSRGRRWRPRSGPSRQTERRRGRAGLRPPRSGGGVPRGRGHRRVPRAGRRVRTTHPQSPGPGRPRPSPCRGQSSTCTPSSASGTLRASSMAVGLPKSARPARPPRPGPPDASRRRRRPAFARTAYRSGLPPAAAR